jgi:hypothetical protein
MSRLYWIAARTPTIYPIPGSLATVPFKAEIPQGPCTGEFVIDSIIAAHDATDSPKMVALPIHLWTFLRQENKYVRHTLSYGEQLILLHGSRHWVSR